MVFVSGLSEPVKRNTENAQQHISASGDIDMTPRIVFDANEQRWGDGLWYIEKSWRWTKWVWTWTPCLLALRPVFGLAARSLFATLPTLPIQLSTYHVEFKQRQRRKRQRRRRQRRLRQRRRRRRRQAQSTASIVFIRLDQLSSSDCVDYDSLASAPTAFSAFDQVLTTALTTGFIRPLFQPFKPLKTVSNSSTSTAFPSL